MLTILFQPLSRGSDHPLLALAQHQHQERQQDPPFAALPNFTVLLCDLVTAVTPAPAAPKATRDHQLYVTDAAQITAALRQRIAQVQRAIPVIVAGDTCSTCGQDTVCSSCNQCHWCEDIDLPCAVHSRRTPQARAAIGASPAHCIPTSCNKMALLARIDEVLAAIEQRREACRTHGDWFIVSLGGRGQGGADDGGTSGCGAALPTQPFAPCGNTAAMDAMRSDACVQEVTICHR